MVIGGHPDIVIRGDRAFIFYFTHPGRIPGKPGESAYESRRSTIQVDELEYDNGVIVCDRNKPVYMNLKSN